MCDLELISKIQSRIVLKHFLYYVPCMYVCMYVQVVLCADSQHDGVLTSHHKQPISDKPAQLSPW